MKNFIKKIIKGVLAFTLLFPTTSKLIIVPQFPKEFVEVPDAPKLIQLSVGKKEVWGVDSKNKIYLCKIKDKEFEWVTQKNRLKYISVGYDDKPWGIGINNVSYACNATKTEWKNKLGKFTQISVGKEKMEWVGHAPQPSKSGSKVYTELFGYIWGVNEDGKLYFCHKELELLSPWNEFKRRPNNNNKPLKYVSCGEDRDIWVIGKDGSIWRWNDKIDDAEWRWGVKLDLWIPIKKSAIWTIPPSGKIITLKQIDVGDHTHVVGINNDEIAYMHDEHLWQKIGNGIADISINKDGDIWLIATNNKVYWSNQGNVEKIRNDVFLSTKAKERAKQYWYETKRSLYQAKQEAEKRTEPAKMYLKTIEKATNRAQEESAQADKAFNQTEESAKELSIRSTKKATESAQTAAQNAKKAAQEAADALLKLLKVEEKTDKRKIRHN